ncbi:DUF2514 family protein [Pseudomonas putida]|uniref:DUF2514 family protein n=1 Tax=Pseudomonas putida TaxID=303 RepID=UPI00226D868F|nr:DUF2514 family protein [Pseudomonas putida]WAB96240.1 DUF2514 family protein [Pseudomonas putida]
MSWLAAVPAWCWWLIALVLVAGGQQYRGAVAKGDIETARRDLADDRLEVSERDRRAAAQARTEEQRRQAVADKKGESARQQLELAKDRAAAAGGLRSKIARLRAGRAATCDTITTQQRQAGTSVVVVLGELLEVSDRMAGSCAAALERSRVDGLACESIYNGLSIQERNSSGQSSR